MGEGESRTSRMQYNRRDKMHRWWWRRGREQSTGAVPSERLYFEQELKHWLGDMQIAYLQCHCCQSDSLDTGRQLQLGFNWKYPLDIGWSMNWQKEKWHHLLGQIGDSATGHRLSWARGITLVHLRAAASDQLPIVGFESPISITNY